MTRPLFINQQQGGSQHFENSETADPSIFGSTNPPMPYLNEDEDSFHLKRVGASLQGGENIINPSSSHTQPSFHNNPSNHHNRLTNIVVSNTENSFIQPINDSFQNRGENYSEKEGFENQNLVDDILEYDEDNVIVIDLDDIRNNPGKESGSTIPSKTMETPKRKVEIKRQVYYDDSDLFSPPPSTIEENEAEMYVGESQNINEPCGVDSSNNGTSYSPRKFSLECLSKDCDPNVDDTIHKITRTDSSTESSETASVNSQNDEIVSDNINHVSLPPPFQSVLDDNDINQDEYLNDNENDLSQKDIVQPPSPFSERSCSSSATTGPSSVKQSNIPNAPNPKLTDVNSATASTLNETIERSILRPQTSILMESDQPVFYEASKFERTTQLVGLDNHSQLTLSSISSDTVCQQDIQVVPLPTSSGSNENKNSQNQTIISHHSSLPPVKVHGRTNLTSAAFNNSHNSRENDNSAISHKNSQFYGSENHQQFTSVQTLVNEQYNEYKIHKDNHLPSELQKEKRDRPNQLFPSVPTSSSVIINNNSCGTSPLPSAQKCRTTQNKNITTGKKFGSSIT